MWATLLKFAKFAAVWELAWWQRRDAARVRVMLDAEIQAKALGRPLLVIGAPDHGMTGGYPCGDITADNEPSSSCPNFVQVDLSSQRLPLADNSVVVFISCVLEYVPDLQTALAELWRVSGGEIYLVRVQPWTLTAFFYPGAQRILPWSSGRVSDGLLSRPAQPLTVQGGIDATVQEAQDTVQQVQSKQQGYDTQTQPLSGFAGAHKKRINNFIMSRYRGR
jgi:hypothetical protein